MNNFLVSLSEKTRRRQERKRDKHKKEREKKKDCRWKTLISKVLFIHYFYIWYQSSNFNQVFQLWALAFSEKTLFSCGEMKAESDLCNRSTLAGKSLCNKLGWFVARATHFAFLCNKSCWHQPFLPRNFYFYENSQPTNPGYVNFWIKFLISVEIKHIRFKSSLKH